MILRGRRKILTKFSSEDLLEPQNLMDFINSTMQVHSYNRTEINYLVDYRNGKQSILDKVKEIRPEINNKLVFNHAQMVTRIVNGYFLGTPIQYIQSGFSDKKDKVDELNRYLAYENKATTDGIIGEHQSICGTAYRMIYTDGEFADEVPFEEKDLNPANTYVAYKNDLTEIPVAGVTMIDTFDEKENIDGSIIYVYTDSGVYEIKGDTSYAVSLDDVSLARFSPYMVGGVPIIEYPNNQWRVGDWELCIDLMDAINSLQNGRLDDVDQNVQSLLVFINAEIDEERYDEMRASGVVSLVNKTNNKSSVESISNSLEQGGMNMFANELENLLYAILGIPDRNNRSGGGGDTGQAVELRDGWADLEIVARNKELMFKQSERRALKIILTILEKDLGLTLKDVDIKFSRNKNNNLSVKTQGYKNLIDSHTLDPVDCLKIVDLVSDENEYMARGKAFWGEMFANKNEMQQQTKEIVEN